MDRQSQVGVMDDENPQSITQSSRITSLVKAVLEYIWGISLTYRPSRFLYTKTQTHKVFIYLYIADVMVLSFFFLAQ